MAAVFDGDSHSSGTFVRLSSIEAFHLFSSSEAWPNCIVSRYRFRGTIDIELAKQAWLHCIERQPHLTWPIEDRFGKTWNTNPKACQPIAEFAGNSFHEIVLDRWPENESEFEFSGVNERGLPHVDGGVGLGLWCIRSHGDQHVQLLFAAHHLLTDGVAAIGFVRQWMTAYHNLCVGEDIDRGLPKLDWHRWQSRSNLGLLSRSFLKYLPCQVIGLFGASKFIFRKFSTIEPGESEREVERCPGIVGRTFSPQVVEQLKERSQRLDVSTNSLLMTILFRAFEHLKRQIVSGDLEHCRWVERNWIRLILPIGTRTVGDRKLPCANKASIVQIERTFAQVGDADAASRSIDREVRVIVGYKLELIFLILMRTARVLPWLLRHVSRNPKSRGTAVFTNLGEPLRKTRACNFRQLGDMELIDFDLCGPIRSGTPLNVVWSQFRLGGESAPADQANAIHGRLSVHFDRKLFSGDEAALLLAAFEKELVDVTEASLAHS